MTAMQTKRGEIKDVIKTNIKSAQVRNFYYSYVQQGYHGLRMMLER